MEPPPNPDRQTPAEVCYETVSGAGGFLAAGGGSLWFTPPHILTMIRPAQDMAFIFANPPYGGSPGGR